MTLSAEQKSALDAVATEVENASTWVSGSRATKLLALGKTLRNFDQEASGLAAEAEARAQAEAAEKAAQAAADAEAQEQARKAAQEAKALEQQKPNIT